MNAGGWWGRRLTSPGRDTMSWPRRAIRVNAMNLTEAETAYLRRFEFEIWFNIHGPGSVREECAALAGDSGRFSYLSDLADLATPSIQYNVLGDVQFETDPGGLEAQYPRVAFPWESLEALHQRVLELDPLSRPREWGTASSSSVSLQQLDS